MPACWRTRLLRSAIALKPSKLLGLHEPRPGAPRTISDEQVQIEKDAAAAFAKAGLAAFEKQSRERFDTVSADPSSWYRRRAEILRAICIVQRDIEAYFALTEQTKLNLEDCLAIAKLVVPRDPNKAKALVWVERGRVLDRESQFRSTAAYDLDKLHRELLSKLGREDEAVEAPWADFRKHPSKSAYDDFMKFVPRDERAVWHEKALNAAREADLHSLLELFTETKETERLASPGRQLESNGGSDPARVCAVMRDNY